MAEGKKAFIVYTDWIKYTELMTIEQKGLWIDWCLKYCNDLEPELPNDPMAKMLCVMCKDILKRDLKKYEEKKERFMKIGKQYETENGKEETPNTIPKSECVNSNKLIVNSNKCVSNDTLNNACACEEAQISKLQDLLNELQNLYGRCLTMMEQAQVEALSKNYDSKLIIDEVKDNLDKVNPIAYVMKKIQNTRNTQFNRGYDDNELLEDEWLKEFNERTRQEEEQRKKELRNED